MGVKTIFQQRLKEARTRAGLTQSELATRCGITQSLVSLFEKGSSTPNLEVVADIAKQLGVSIDWICGFDGNTQPITPLQWLLFTDDLLGDPPKTRNSHGPQQMIQLRMNPEKNVVAAIEFSGKDMEEFFRAYSALSSTREQIGDLYKTVIFALMQKYEICFMPGAKVNYVVPSVELNDLQKSMVDGGETVRINLGAPLS